MKIIIKEHGGMVSVDFKGPDKHALHALELLMMATIESMVVKLRTNLTDAEVEDLMDKFGKSMKSSAIARYKLGPTTNMTGFSDKEAAFLSKLFNLRPGKKKEPARVPTRTSQKGDEFRRPSPQK